jgi:CDP-diacylglycerol--serine O-phosphatidyltransferase
MQQPEAPNSFTRLLEPPDFVTLAGLCCALLAMAAALQQRLDLAALLLTLSVVADLLDGKLARALGRRNRDFGAAFDTVCDAVAFGAAPVLFGLCAGLATPLGLAALAAYLCAAALRLARFQASSRSTTHYTGMPVPYGNVAVVLAYLMVPQPQLATVLVALYPLLAALMVSTVRWPKF